MKQVLQSLKTGAVTLADVPAPLAPDNGVLVRSIASLVSAGTERMVVEFAEKNLLQKARARPDLARQVLQRLRREGLRATFDTVRRNLDQPMPLGYSLVGEVIDVGRDATGVQVGDVVACAGATIANHAEFAAVPQMLFAPLPRDFGTRVPVEHAAFTTLGAIALHGFRLARPQLGERVAVVGLGLLGQLSVQIARAAGCRVFGVDLDPARVALARELGADAAVRDQAEAEGLAFSAGMGFDVVLLTADTRSNDPVELAAMLARDRAQVIAVGAFDLSLPRKPFFAKELHFQVSRSYGPGRYDPGYELHGHDYPPGFVRWTEQRNLDAFVHLLDAGAVKVERLITHRFPIGDAPRAYDVITGKVSEPFLGVVLTYPETATPVTRVDRAGGAGIATVSGEVGASLVGAGLFAGATLVPALKAVEGVRLRGIVSAHGVSAKTLGDNNGFAFSASRLDDVLQDEGTQAVFILTRHHLHAAQAIAALDAGKHVFVEKPLCLTLDELAAVEHACTQHPDRVLTVGFNRRFAPLAKRMREFLATGEPSVLTYRVNAGFLPSEHWTQDPAQGGGRLLGEACHFIDFAAWFARETPDAVVARAMNDIGRYRQDNLAITLTFPSGSLATIVYVANGDKHAGKERVEAFAGGRLAVLDDFRTLDLHRDGKVERVRGRGPTDKGHAAECRAFVDAIRGRGGWPIPLDDLLGSMRATFAAQESLATGALIRLGQLPDTEPA